MKFYHGTKIPDLKKLSLEKSLDGYVYLTNNRLSALVYACREYPNLFAIKENKICFYEIVPNLFEIMFKGKVAYIYTLQNPKEFEKVERGNNCAMNDCYRTKQDVNFVDKSIITDCFVELKKYVESGDITIIKQNEFTDDFLLWHINKLIETKLPSTFTRENYKQYIFKDKKIKEIAATNNINLE